MTTDPSILLCLSAHAGAQATIRHAARLAVEQQVALYALHVEPPGASTRRSPAEAAQLISNQQLARDLGAQLWVLCHHRVAATVLQFAHDHGCTTIVLGGSARPVWRRRLCASLARALAAGSPAQIIEVARGDGLWARDQAGPA